MAHADIRAVNLNLLAAFDALLEERNVTRAASKMGVTQSAMSSSLAQLRLLFEDPLFRRTPRGIEPTPRALELGDPIRRGLGLFDRALTPRSFEPRSESRVFVLATSDYVEFVLLPPLLKRLAREAPGVRLEVRPWGLQQVPRTLQSGEVDLMIGFYNEVPAHHAETLLFDEHYLCIARKGHPVLKGSLTAKRFAAYPHLLVSPQGDSSGVVDQALRELGLRRRTALTVAHFLCAPWIIADTDLVTALPERIARRLLGAAACGMRELPLKIPSYTVGLVQSKDSLGDPLLSWLTTVIREVAADG